MAMKVNRSRERNLRIAGKLSAFEAHAFHQRFRIDAHLLGVRADDAVEIDALGEQFKGAVFERVDLIELDLGALADLFGERPAFSRACLSSFPTVMRTLLRDPCQNCTPGCAAFSTVLVPSAVCVVSAGRTGG